MSISETSLQRLGELANIICDIDICKKYSPHLIPNLADVASQTIELMKSEGFEIGALPSRISDIAQCTPQTALACIEAAHDEIARLLGDKAHLVYEPEEAMA